jgi:hypothetical protein
MPATHPIALMPQSFSSVFVVEGIRVFHEVDAQQSLQRQAAVAQADMDKLDRRAAVSGHG